MKEMIDRFIKLAEDKNNPDAAKSFFLGQIEGDYTPLLWKCYLSHMAGRKKGYERKERIALLGSSNVMPLKDMLKAVFHANNIQTDYYAGEHGNFMQEMMIGSSGLYSFKPTVTILIISPQDMIRPIYEEPFSYGPKAVDAILSKAAQDLKSPLERYSSALADNITYIAVLPPIEDPSSYVYSPGPAYKSENYAAKFENAVEDSAAGRENIILLNMRRLILKHPANKIEDKRYWYLGGIRYTDLFFSEIAREAMAVYRMINFPSKKCLILDLDNTLWGGVVGQDGLEGIVLGQDGLGKAFQDFQREVLKLYKKGIMLALCSKNNEADALEVFDKHTEMLLKRDNFASMYINWDDKVSNIKKIAHDLNIGLDSMVFLDDDPAEKKWVRDNLSEVAVPDLPDDPFMYAEFMKGSGWFNSYRLSEEDISRNVTYTAIEKAKKLKASAGTTEAFLKSLRQEVTLEAMGASTVSRAAQLCQKTNQFNLTTKRYQAQDLKEIARSRANHIYTVRVKDCFCDYGVVGLLILKESAADKEVFVDTFLLSCRIIGRRIEFAILEWLKDTYRKRSFKKILGLYSETEKSVVSSKLYKDNGFSEISKDKKGHNYYYDLKKISKAPNYKKFIRIVSKKA